MSIHIPHDDREATGAVPAATPARTVMVVEDEQLVRDLVRRVLETNGHRAVAASSGSEAEAILAKPNASIDIVILDVTLPDVDGAELARRWSSAHPTLPVLLVSGFDRSEAGDDAPQPRRAFLRKPFRPAQLIDHLVRLLAQ